MFPRALKTNIVISIVLLLLIGMLLINFVVVRTTQRTLIQEKMSKGYLTILLLADTLTNDFSGDARPDLFRRLKPHFADVLSDRDFTGIYLMDRTGRIVYSAGKESAREDGLEKLMQRTMASGDRRVRLSGSTWGVFWYQRKHLTVSMPVREGSAVTASLGISMDLEPVYAGQRRSQRFVFFYLVVNILILTVIGFYRLSKVYLEPINRLVRIAEAYQETDGTFFPVRKQDNELSQLSKALNGMIRRISEDKKALRSAVDSLEKTNLKLKAAQEEIIRAEKLASVGRLASGIAHEIGNPIGIVSGYLELLKKNGIDAQEKKEYLARISKEIHRMDTVIRQLLDLSRTSSDETGIVSVHDIVTDLADVLRVQPLMAKVRLDLSLKAENDAVKADPNRLRQVFINLAINAADAIAAGGTADEGRLIIQSANPAAQTGAPSAEKLLSVTFGDNGVGISPKHLGSIFDPFFTTKEPGKGTGLGLSVCFMIVESMGGAIHVDSRESDGTVMTVELPLAD